MMLIVMMIMRRTMMIDHGYLTCPNGVVALISPGQSEKPTLITKIFKGVGQLFISSDPGIAGVRSLGLDVFLYERTRGVADLTDVTLADEDTNAILTDDVNRAIM